MKEIVRELKIQRQVDFHDNIIRYYGITKLESENHNNYGLVMEYADDGTLRSYLKENFNKLTWDDKYNMAYQLSCAVSCLHNERIVHRDLHSFVEISQGLREIVVPDTPEEYVKIYTKCWDGEPDNRPTIYQVVDWLNAIITKSDVIIENHQMSNEQELNETSLSTNNSELQGQLIQNFDKMIIKEIGPMAISSKQENHSTEKDFNIMVDDNWSYVMGITPSTATQVASPISPVSVINPNYSYPIQDEEEEGRIRRR
ncbi:kinase-like domain-containing protein [Rhizophagus irregularis DAOM 181602=DAOM 197198]|nr:kinase-like domain-containing protein [Rhizophagus irregularis DAOM 181602=DAOM 197198]